jgi:multiple antibiotic resistance protein
MIDGFLVARIVADFLFGFSTLISIINPFGIAFVFRDMTRWTTPQERAALARAIAVNSFVVILASLFLGARVLAFFGISLEALRIGGGLAVAVSGWQMLRAPVDTDAAPKAMDTAPIQAMAFFPLTVPLTTGPGAISAAIALGADRSSLSGGQLLIGGASAVLVASAVAVAIWLSYRYADAIARRLGPQGTLIVTKLAAFLLLCVGVQIILTGVTDALVHIIAQRPPA